MVIPAAVLTALDERTEKLSVLLAEHLDAVMKAQAAFEATQRELTELSDYRARLQEAANQPLGGLSALSAHSEDVFRRARRNEVRAVVLDSAFRLAQSKGFFKSEDVLRDLKERGIELDVKNPLVRLSQVLTLDTRFENDRALGWHLKGKERSPGGAGLLGATESVEDLI